MVCQCGKDISTVPATPIEGDIPIESFGDIDSSISVYVQQCSSCGTLNYTHSPDKPVEICRNCNKRRIAGVQPVLLNEFDRQKNTDTEVPSHEQPCEAENTQPEPVLEAQNPWATLLSGIGPLDNNVETNVSNGTSTHKEENESDRKRPNSNLTLNAISYGSFQVTFSPERGEVLLGRFAECADFLSNDLRVSNEHCYLRWRNGKWYVADNNSRNSTRLDSVIVQPGQERVLYNGAELKLGNQDDSMRFRVTIG